ncbi:MAG: hypothetical protein A3D46_00260 [Candidatus Nealsonbacteria bacterium RIFCSPHIGHO2_02_FULL_43_13]|uniref:Transposase IS200-like domain-containing protein n=1 Tax=Candidatus Nealsonbacteria bacterium RIFCSPHIGHO2_02_FULL_43_13 TaxID=1801668 RepID=A0A1G2E5V0_9BACT|nr:MAG: hypothetical protein A3D46_00260 [Candidatus Nealsonbacteria bacterium RIFCSPHIGHO2_02_FULL_43_13]
MRKIQFHKGNFYHIYNRGVEKRDIFKNDNDRWRFLQGLFMFNDEKATANLLWQLEKTRGGVTFGVLRDFFKKDNRERKPLVRILVDCLMPNHFHLLIEEIKEGGISCFMHKLGVGYTKYFNNKYKRVGSLYQGTFKAALIDNEKYLQYLLVYINVLNPGELVEPNLKENGIKNIEKVMQFAEEYQWSTQQEYLNKRNSIIIEKGLLGEFFSSPSDYQKFVKSVLLDRKFDEISSFTLE